MQIKSIIFSLAVAILFTDSSFAADDVTVKIGHVAPMSGPNALFGRDNENGAKMAIEELNAQNTMIDGRRVRFELVNEDDAGEPKQAVAAAVKLANAGVNGVVGHLNSSTSIAAAKIYRAAGIPQISPSATAAAYTSLGYDTTFRVVASDEQLGGILGRYAVQTLKAKTIVVIDNRTLYGQSVADEFVKGAKAEARIKNSRINLRRLQLTNEKAANFAAVLEAIKAANPDVVFYGGMDYVAGPLLRQMKAVGIKAKFIGGDGICTPQLAKFAVTEMVDGQVTCAVTGGVIDTQEVAYDNFRDEYKKKFGVGVVIYAPYSYDAVMTLVDAMQQAKSSSPAVYLPFLQNVRHKGITGDIAFDRKGNIRDGTLTMYTFKSGKRQQIGIFK